MRRLLTRLTEHGYALAVLAMVVSTAIFLPGRAHFAQSQWALLYLLIVVLVAGASGTGPAILAAILAFFAWDFFFLPPYHTLQVRDPKDWLALGAFLVVGIVMGIQTGRMREREARAVAREREAALLNRLTANLVSQTTTQSMAETVLRETVESLGAASATLFVAEGGGLHSFCASPPSQRTDAATEDTAEWVFSHGQPVGLPGTGAAQPAQQTPAGGGVRALGDAGGVFLPLRSPSGVAGVLTVETRPDGRPYNDADGRLLASLANLIAVFLERQRLQSAATQAEASREADRLKSSLLSSVSHELKTPLAALTATVSNLLESDVAWDERSVRDELRAIVADITRLNNSIGALLDLSRLEARAWEPRREPYDLAERRRRKPRHAPCSPTHPRGRSCLRRICRRSTSTSCNGYASCRTCSRTPCCTRARRAPSESAHRPARAASASGWRTKGPASLPTNRRPCSRSSTADGSPACKRPQAPAWASPSRARSCAPTAARSWWRMPARMEHAW